MMGLLISLSISIDRTINKCRQLFWGRKFGMFKGKMKIDSNVTFQNPECLFFGKSIGIGKNTYFLPTKEYAGKKYSPKIIIGSGCWIGIRNSFAAIDRIEIGENVLFAGYVHITDHSHGYEDTSSPIKSQPLISKGPVIIEDNCWLGFGCEILSGVHVGRNSVVAARAVVTKNVPAYSVVAGNPAKIIKRFDPRLKKWVKEKKSDE